MTENWWRAPLGAEPRARWLGLFPVLLRIREGAARQLLIAARQTGDIEQPSAGVDGAVAGPGSVRLNSLLRAPGAVDPGFPPLDANAGGSVNLHWRIYERPRVVPPWATPGQDRDDPEPPAQSGSEEVPLWKRLTYLLQLRADLLLAPGGPIEWPGALFDYQLDGIGALLSRDALLLADDMGLGKTIQALAALRILVLRQEIESALVVVPAGLVSQWHGQVRLWAPELRVSTVRGPTAERAWQWQSPAHLYLVSYETLREDFTANPASPPRRRCWDLVLLDEAQRIKNRETDLSRACKLLRRRRAWALSGTPLENREDDLASILEFVRPKPDDGRPVTLWPGAAVREEHRATQLRRRKVDVLPQLPPKLLTRVVLPLTRAQRETYERAERDGILRLRQQGEAARIENVLELITRLKQICNFCPSTGESGKLDDLRERILTLAAEGHRALIFSQFTGRQFGVRAIAAHLDEVRPLIYTGDLSARQRDEVVQRFKADSAHRALVVSLRAGGQGLNLQEASYVFHFDRWWNPAMERQAEDRSHRLGQVLPVTVYSYTCEGTIEERIDQVLRGKRALFDELIDDVSIDLGSALTGEELFGLFGLAPPPRRPTRPR